MSMTERLMSFLDQSPSGFHAIANLTRQLEEAGYTALSEAAGWQLKPGGKYYLTRNQSALIAFRVPQGTTMDLCWRPVIQTVPALK